MVNKEIFLTGLKNKDMFYSFIKILIYYQHLGTKTGTKTNNSKLFVLSKLWIVLGTKTNNSNNSKIFQLIKIINF
jgi:hypothetical protein